MREQQVFPYNETIEPYGLIEGEVPQQVPFGEGTTYPLEPRPDMLYNRGYSPEEPLQK